MDRKFSDNLNSSEKSIKFIGCYCRVSTDEQARGENIDGQKIEINSYLDTYDEPYTVSWYIDEGISGATFMHERPDGQRLMADIIDGKLDQVIVVRVDRLAREDLVAQVIYHSFKDHNIDLVSIKERFDYTTPTGQLMANTFSNFASYERILLKQRLASGRVKNAYKGKWNGGNIPYGYLRDAQGNFILDPETSQNYILIKNMMLQGHGANYIREQLKTLGILSPSGDPIWSKRTLVYMLRNPFYKGEVKYKDIQKPGEHPALISSEDFDIVQAQINQRGHRGNSYPYHLLSGLIKCNCGKGFAIRYTGKNHVRRYCCQHKYETTFNCQAPLLDADSLEDAIVNIIMDFASKPDAIQEAMDTANQLDSESSIRAGMKRVAALERQIKGVQKLIRKKDEMYAAGTMSDEQYEGDIKSLYEREKKLREEYIAHKQELDQAAKKDTDHKEYIKLIRDLKKYWPQIDPEARQRAIRVLITNIQVEEEYLVINFREFSIPLEPSMSSRGCWWFK